MNDITEKMWGDMWERWAENIEAQFIANEETAAKLARSQNSPQLRRNQDGPTPRSGESDFFAPDTENG